MILLLSSFVSAVSNSGVVFCTDVTPSTDSGNEVYHYLNLEGRDDFENGDLVVETDAGGWLNITADGSNEYAFNDSIRGSKTDGIWMFTYSIYFNDVSESKGFFLGDTLANSWEDVVQPYVDGSNSKWSYYDGSAHTWGDAQSNKVWYNLTVIVNITQSPLRYDAYIRNSTDGVWIRMFDEAAPRGTFNSLEHLRFWLSTAGTVKMSVDDIRLINGTECPAVGAGAAPDNPAWVYPSVDNQNNNTNITINISHSGLDVNISFYVDDSLYFYNMGMSVIGSHFNWTTNFSDGTYVLKASVYNYSNDEWSSNISRTLTIDTVSPTITRLSGNGFQADNSTIMNPYLNNLSINISFFDTNLYQTLINITNTSGQSVYQKLNTSIGGTTVNVSWEIDTEGWAIGNYTVKLVATDTHTAKLISDYRIVEGLNYFRYTTSEGNLIKIESSAMPIFKRTEKEIDRYNFEFNYLFSLETFKFKITSYNKMDYISDSSYPAHFVIMGKDGNGNWLDFGGIDKKDVTVIKKDDYTYDVEITSNGERNFKFSSLGGLNRKEEHYLLRLGSVLDVWVGDTTTGIGIDATATIGTQSANTVTNTSPATLQNITKETISLTLNSTGYGTEVKSISLTDNYHNLSFNMTPVSAVQIHYYDEISEALIFGETFSTYLETTGFSNTYGGITGNPYSISGLSSGLYELKASSSNYPERQYLDVNVTNTTTTGINVYLSFYLINTTLGAERTFVVKDLGNSELLEDVTVNFTRVINGTNTIIAQEETDYAGACKLYLDDDYEYKIVFEKNSYKTKTINLEPSDSSYTVYLNPEIDVSPPIVESYQIRKIDFNLSFTNSTKEVLFGWNDPNNYADELCLQVYDLNKTYYANCSDDTTSITTYTITADNTTIMAKAYAKRNNRNYPLKTISINLLKAAVTLGKESLILVWMIFITLGFLGLAKPIVAIILGILSLSGMYLVGMLPIGFGTIMGLIFVAIIIAVGIKKSEREI